MILSVLFLASMVPITSQPGGAIRGSGVLIAPQLVLTALHVVVDAPFAVRCGGEEIPAILVARAPGVDLAIIELAQVCNRPISKIAKADPELGAVVYAEGCPNSTCGWRLYGHMTGYDISTGTNGDGFRVLVSEAPIWFGSSGGPLFNDKKEVVGLSHAVQTWERDNTSAKQVFGFFVPADTINEFLKQAIK